MLQMKTRIARHQLAWIIADCFGEEEIVTLANQCGILHDGKRISTIPKEWFANDLATCCFKESLAEEIVIQCLQQKAEQIIRRVQYMSVEEIQFFMRSANQLREDGELGKLLWALLMDLREDVQQHGYRLLADHEQYFPPLVPLLESDTATLDNIQKAEPLEEDAGCLTSLPPDVSGEELSPEPAADIPTPLPTDPYESLQVQPNPVVSSDSLLRQAIEQNEQQIKQLNETISELKNEYTALQNENDKLYQKIEQLAKENQILKNKENSYKERETHLHQLERENRSLKQELEKYSDLISEYYQIQLEKEKLATELKSVEEAAVRSQQVLERMRSEFQSQFIYLQRVNEDYKTAVVRAQKRALQLGAQRPSGKVSKNPIMDGRMRVGVFVDVQNMFYAAKDRYSRRLDYIKLLDLIVGPRNLVIAYAYVVQIPEINQSGFLSLLEHNGYTIKSKELRMRGDGSAKGDWDVGIAIDVVSMLDGLDVVILASGDGDFCALAELIKKHGKRIEVVAFEHNTSLDLLRMVDQFFPIGDDMLI